MNRQDQFERVYAELTGREVEAIKAMRFRITEGYASPKIADAYRMFCATQAVDPFVVKALERAQHRLEVFIGDDCEMSVDSMQVMLDFINDAVKAAKGVEL